ncbi:MAG: type II secretion system minor pseudopilin GspJ [Pseudomonas sp.]|uniref:type II secretion system minor pseudopilin GspJ n=1 Tax=Pseudomonas sp. TaxID=306 RepID=UPI003399D3E0
MAPLVAQARASRGFTLLELLIAISIFALLGLGTYRMLDSVLRTDEATRNQEQVLREVARAVWTLERDLLQVVARPIRDGYAEPRQAFLGESEALEGGAAFELTRSGWRNPTGITRSQLQRVRWRLSGETLERVYWVVLDQAVDSQPRVQKVLTGVSALTVRYMDKENTWLNDWPPEGGNSPGNSDGSGGEQKPLLPQAVEVTLEHQRYGKIVRLLRLPDGPAEAAPTPGGGEDGETPPPADGETDTPPPEQPPREGL